MLRFTVLMTTALLTAMAANAQVSGTLPVPPPGSERPDLTAPRPYISSNSGAVPQMAAEPYMYTPYKFSTAIREVDHVVIATAVGSQVAKDTRGLLWTVTRFQVNAAAKGGFANNTFDLYVVGGASETPEMHEYVVTGGLDLNFTPGMRYVMLLQNSGEGNRVVAARQQVFPVEEGSNPVVRDLKGGTIDARHADGTKYAAGEPLLLTDLWTAIGKLAGR